MDGAVVYLWIFFLISYNQYGMVDWSLALRVFQVRASRSSISLSNRAIFPRHKSVVGVWGGGGEARWEVGPKDISLSPGDLYTLNTG
jgi:hypothetical protein